MTKHQKNNWIQICYNLHLRISYPDYIHHVSNRVNDLKPSIHTLETANRQPTSSMIAVPKIIPNCARFHIILIKRVTPMLLYPISQHIPILTHLHSHATIDSIATDIPKCAIQITHDILTKRIKTTITVPISGHRQYSAMKMERNSYGMAWYVSTSYTHLAFLRLKQGAQVVAR